MSHEQRTEEWFEKRAGKITASRVADLMARIRGGQPGASRANMIMTLAVERLTGRCVSTYQNDAMRRGTEMEPYAIQAYADATGNSVERADFIDHPDIPNVGFSPDGIVGEDGLLEVKCPTSMEKHFKALESNAHVTEYKWQLQHQLFVSGREWVDMCSYHPDFPAAVALCTARVFPDAELQEQLREEIEKSNAEIDERVARMQAMIEDRSK